MSSKSKSPAANTPAPSRVNAANLDRFLLLVRRKSAAKAQGTPADKQTEDQGPWRPTASGCVMLRPASSGEVFGNRLTGSDEF